MFTDLQYRPAPYRQGLPAGHQGAPPSASGGGPVGEESLRLVQVRAMAGVLDYRLAVAAPGRGVTVEHRPGLRHRRLRREGLLPGQPGTAPMEPR